ncbi:2982_t:CDS:2, partial [Cetraspora pellucida]
MYHVIEKLKEMFEPITINIDNLNIENEKDAFDKEDEQTNKEQIMLNNPDNAMDLLYEVKAKIYTILCYYYPDLIPQGLVSALLDPQLNEYENQNSNNANKTDNCMPNDNLLYTPCLLQLLEKDDSQVVNEIDEYFRIPEISLRKDPL